MSRLRFSIVLTLCAAVVAVQAGGTQAQIASGRSGSSSLIYIDQSEALITLSWFGRCYAAKNRDDALTLLTTRPGSRAEADTFRKLFRGSKIACMAMNTDLRVPIAYVRGVIAEGFLHAGMAVPTTHQLAVPAVVNVRTLAEAARCYASTHRSEVQDLLATKPASKKEMAAVSALTDNFAKCVPSKDPLQLYTTLVRFSLTEALLRLQPTTNPVATEN